jgi:hypothetical protein
MTKAECNELPREFIPEWNSDRIDLKNYGSVIYSYGLCPRWGIWTGPLLESMLPWMPKIKEYFSGLRISAVSWSDSSEPILKHIDGVLESEKSIIYSHINYIVSCEDPTNKTILYDNDGKTEYYPSIPGTAWLMDPTKEHEVQCTSYREVFQIKFANPFNEVSECLKGKPPLNIS